MKITNFRGQFNSLNVHRFVKEKHLGDEDGI